MRQFLQGGDLQTSHSDCEVDRVFGCPLGGQAGVEATSGSEKALKVPPAAFAGGERSVGSYSYGEVVGSDGWSRLVVEDGGAECLLTGKNVINDARELLGSLPWPGDAGGADVVERRGGFQVQRREKVVQGVRPVSVGWSVNCPSVLSDFGFEAGHLSVYISPAEDKRSGAGAVHLFEVALETHGGNEAYFGYDVVGVEDSLAKSGS